MTLAIVSIVILMFNFPANFNVCSENVELGQKAKVGLEFPECSAAIVMTEPWLGQSV